MNVDKTITHTKNAIAFLWILLSLWVLISGVYWYETTDSAYPYEAGFLHITFFMVIISFPISLVSYWGVFLLGGLLSYFIFHVFQLNELDYIALYFTWLTYFIFGGIQWFFLFPKYFGKLFVFFKAEQAKEKAKASQGKHN